MTTLRTLLVAAALAALVVASVAAAPSLGLKLKPQVGVARAPLAWPRLHGFVAATPTAFAANDSSVLDMAALARQAAELAAAPPGMITAVFVCGTTGESMSLTLDERKRVAEVWKSLSAGYGYKLIVHVGTSTVEDSIALAQHAASIGADAIGAMPPFFFKPTDPADLVDTMAPIAAAAPNLPFYYYHIPSMTGVTIAMHDFLAQNALTNQIPNLAGIKFTDYDMFDLFRIVHFDNRRYNVLIGRDEALLAGLAIGVDGAVGSTYNFNFMNNVYYNLVKAFDAADMDRAQAYQLTSVEVVQLLHEYGSGATKGMMTLSGIDTGPPRLPQQPLTPSQLSQLRAALVKLGLL